METNKITCYKCRGLKIMATMGGLTKSCTVCDETGMIARTSSNIKPVELDVSNPPRVKKPKKAATARGRGKSKVFQGVVENFSLADIFPGIESVKQPMLAGYSDQLIVALLEEPRCDPLKWRQQYQDVKELFNVINNEITEVMSKVERAAIREIYARSIPISPRKVDIMKMQEMVK